MIRTLNYNNIYIVYADRTTGRSGIFLFLIRTINAFFLDLESDSSICSEKVHPDMSMSALWYSDIREKVKNTKMSDQELNELKSDELIPGKSKISLLHF